MFLLHQNNHPATAKVGGAFPIFVLSIIYALGVLVAERFVGMGLDFHPDALNYLRIGASSRWDDLIFDPLNFIGSFYYFVVALMVADPDLVIGLNMVVYAITNFSIFSAIKNSGLIQNQLAWMAILAILLLDPYRVHLAVHPLKDSFVLLLVVLLVNNKSIFRFLIILIFGLFFTNRYFIYFSFIALLFFSHAFSFSISTNRLRSLFTLPLVSLCSIVFLFLFIHYYPVLLGSLSVGQGANMQFRSFDTIPSFYHLGYPISEILRSISWPLILISGGFAIFSVTYAVAITPVIALWLILLKRGLSIQFFLVLAFCGCFGFVVSGFSTYIRYCYPVLISFIVFSYSRTWRHD